MNISRITFFLITSIVATASLRAEDNTLTAEEVEAGWQLLFDGESIAGTWQNFKSEGITDISQVKDGTFGITDNSGQAGDLVTVEHFENFEFKIDWKIEKGGNSGLFLRVSDKGGKAHSLALEVQMIDDFNFKDRKGKGPGNKQKSGSIYDLVAAKPGHFKGHDVWNTHHVIFDGKALTVYMNGELVSETVVGSEGYMDVFTKSKFGRRDPKGEKFAVQKAGPIGLQDHKNIVSFKNAKIRKLD